MVGSLLTHDPIELAGGTNLYAYAGNNPISFSDPFGLDTIEVQTHDVAGSGIHHASIRITPKDQKRWAGDSRFQKGADGRVFTTLGAGPKLCAKGLCLVSEHNRRADAAPHTRNTGVDLQGRDENTVISALLAADVAYGDNLQYELVPEAADRSYNSNSYVSGMLQAVGVPVPAINAMPWGVPVPGYGKPIP